MNRAGFSLNVVPFHPFKIYQPTNFSSFTTGIAFLTPGSGVGTVCNIDSTKPTNFTSVPPTVNPSTDAFRFWSVRSGQVEVRPIYTLLGTNPAFGADGSFVGDPNNWGFKYDVETNADGVSPYSAVEMEYDDSTTETVNPPLIFAGTPDPENPIGFSIWIQITPDTSSSTLVGVQIQATTCNTDDGSFPTSSRNMIPVGVVQPEFDLSSGQFITSYFVAQELFDHCVGRFPPGNGNYGGMVGSNPGFGGLTNWRGQWIMSSNAFTPGDLASQIFYAGDTVFVENSNGFNQIYEFIGGNSGGGPAMWTSPPADAGNWIMKFWASST